MYLPGSKGCKYCWISVTALAYVFVPLLPNARKGNKTRTVILHPELSKELREYGNGRSGVNPVFRSQKKGHLVPKSIRTLCSKRTENNAVRIIIIIQRHYP
jgi:hypothetical protein